MSQLFPRLLCLKGKGATPYGNSPLALDPIICWPSRPEGEKASMGQTEASCATKLSPMTLTAEVSGVIEGGALPYHASVPPRAPLRPPGCATPAEER